MSDMNMSPDISPRREKQIDVKTMNSDRAYAPPQAHKHTYSDMEHLSASKSQEFGGLASGRGDIGVVEVKESGARITLEPIG